ncbi:MAG: exo-alpha-sialidase [Verrucomicrobia bacterium]|nr:exo-alpha-sialidase [Verrucomicrobiota bacterium]
MQRLVYVPNGSERKGRIFHVAQRNPKANDANPGTKTLPFKTISKAAALAKMHDSVVIDAGVYREEIILPEKTPLFDYFGVPSFRAAPGKKVWIRGSDVFAPEWRPVAGSVYRARLPEELFNEGAYNPYRLSTLMDAPDAVRPCAGPMLPETLGQLYLNDQPLNQLTSEADVLATRNSFAILADGREVLVHFPGRTPPQDGVELTIRQRCFKPLFKGPVMIQTVGLDVRHAAEPGPFCRCRPLTIRCNPGIGIVVHKTGPVLDGDEATCSDMGFPAYVSATSIVMRTVVTKIGTNSRYVAESEDGGRHWCPVANPSEADPGAPGSYFLDPAKNVLIRSWQRDRPDADQEGSFGKMSHEVMVQYSRDGACTWTAPEILDCSTYYYRLIVLRNGELLWPYECTQDGRLKSGVMIGTWRADLSGVNWQRGPLLEVTPGQSGGGACEMQVCQFPDGRVFAILRQQGGGLVSDITRGWGAKFRSVSADNGRTWSALEPLTDEEGGLVYSGSSWPGTIASSKTGKVYVLFNPIVPNWWGCEMRLAVHIAEVDPERLCLLKKTIAVIETRHPEHHQFVRFSNWQVVEERGTGRWLLFMKLAISEYCPLRLGYDFATYRYAISLPE